MTKRLYTRTVVPGLGGETPFTADEHARAYQAEWGEHFRSREELLRWYLRLDADKLPAAGFLINLAARIGARTIVSFGAGPAVIEYVTALGLPGDSLISYGLRSLAGATDRRAPTGRTYRPIRPFWGRPC